MYQNKGNASGGDAHNPPPYNSGNDGHFYTGQTYQVCDNIRHIAIIEEHSENKNHYLNYF